MNTLSIYPSGQGNELVITHNKIAQELGTAREVVSRILKELERENLIVLSRGRIVVDEIRALQRKLNLLHT